MWTSSRWWKVRLRDTVNVRAVQSVYVCDFGPSNVKGKKATPFIPEEWKENEIKIKWNSHEEYFSFRLATHTFFSWAVVLLHYQSTPSSCCSIAQLELPDQRVPLVVKRNLNKQNHELKMLLSVPARGAEEGLVCCSVFIFALLPCWGSSFQIQCQDDY